MYHTDHSFKVVNWPNETLGRERKISIKAYLATTLSCVDIVGFQSSSLAVDDYLGISGGRESYGLMANETGGPIYNMSCLRNSDSK